MKAPAGAEVGIYLDMRERVNAGDVIQTGTGRRYGIVRVRIQERGQHRGRQHLRCLVLGPDDVVEGHARVFKIWWYPRGRK